MLLLQQHTYIPEQARSRALFIKSMSGFKPCANIDYRLELLLVFTKFSPRLH